MFYLGRKGGQAMMRRRFKEQQLRRAQELYEKYGFLAVVVPAMLPPPVPFKLFVLLAGVVNMSVVSFSFATIVGRGARYLIEGLLALWFGERAFEFLKANGRAVALVVGVAALLGGVLYYIRRRRETAA
jgi:membrane protein YqaA with SNARE-associated domain